jgi:signal transduction histidine kinase
VTLACSPQDLRVSIRDDGRGFTRGSNGANGGGADGGHYGLVGMRERASQIGAEFELSSTPGLGTRVSVRVPVTREIPAASSPEKVAALR